MPGRSHVPTPGNHPLTTQRMTEMTIEQKSPQTQTFDQTIVIETPGETIEFPEQDIRSVWVGGRQISELHALVQETDRERTIAATVRAEQVTQEGIRNRRMLCWIGISTLVCVAVTVALVSYVVAEVHFIRDMLIDPNGFLR